LSRKSQVAIEKQKLMKERRASRKKPWRHLPYEHCLVEKARELRRNMTPAETKLWLGFLRGYPFRVLRQKPIDRYIVDFYCSALKLVIEIDGESHYTNEGKSNDEERRRILEGYGLRVVRFTNEDIRMRFEGVCTVLSNLAKTRANPPCPP
jgi:very-short-patch-repair endonuclease